MLDMAAKFEAHRGQEPIAETVLLPGAESRKERGCKDIGRYRFLDRRIDRPASLSRILDLTGKGRERRVLGQRHGSKIEQPGRDDTTAPPHLRDVCKVKGE